MSDPALFARRAVSVWLLPFAQLLAGCDDSLFVSEQRGPNGKLEEVEPHERPQGGGPRDTALGGNASGRHRCVEGPAEQYEDPIAEARQLHVVGIYQSPAGAVAVGVHRPGNSILFLSASVATEWNVSAADGVDLERVILIGYEAQTAHVPAGVPVEVYTYGYDGLFRGESPYQWPSYQATDLVDAAEAMTGRRLTSFRGCSASNGFDIDPPGEIRPPHPVTGAVTPTILPGCERIATESNYCMAMGDGLVMFGLDSGQACTGPDPVAYRPYSSSLGWTGDYVYACDYTRGILRISVVDGSVDVAPVACEMVTSGADGLVGLVALEPGEHPVGMGHLTEFDGFEDAVARAPRRTFDLDPFATRIALRGERAYFAWHSTDTVDTAVLADGAPIESISLEGYDNWIMGMDVTDDGQLVVADLGHPTTLHRFDAATGAARGSLPLDPALFELWGMKCVHRR